ncbi:carbohydrate ABC transporter permease [Streptomyces millisiae]|uniref:Carbohydrate ABC transporter permease n=1 Tax=Streptomyces millisiae TaxID=3075542 RepID=A0ABU2LZF5_9ACTN|nr:carbohydrate ABC transporter permease [Streptomyces sp. DSM 44918]MDT0322951.1 carbohydrate ABC transporter permease [Streptomyces sp. DSM 44918]
MPAPTAPTRARRRRPSLPRVLTHLTLLSLTALWLVPLVGLVIYAFRTSNDSATSGWWTAFANPLFTARNLVDAYTTGGLGQGLLNSALITVPTTVITVLVCAIGAYTLARSRFRGRVVILLCSVALLVVPPQLTLVPLLRLFRTLGLVGEIPGIWIYQVGFVVPFGIYLLYGFYRAFPDEILEAAALDGAGPVRTFLRIALPSSVPVLASLGITQFMWSWNDLLVPLVFLGGSPSVAPATVQVAGLAQSTGGGLNIVSAGAVLAMAVPIVVTLALQRFFIRGILGGAVKG